MSSAPIVPPEQLDVESQLCWGRVARRGPPVKLRESLVKYLEVAMRQGRRDSFFETGSRGAMDPVESDDSVDRGRSFATEAAVEYILEWRTDIEEALPGLLVDHCRQVDEDVRYLLEGVPSDPGGPFAPRDDDDELRDDEEAFRRRHLERLDHTHHLAALQRNELPDEEAWGLESEDEAVSDDDDDDDEEEEEDADGSRCAGLFSRVGGALAILLVAAGLCVQYYVLAFPVESPED